MLPNLLSSVACAISAGTYTDSADITVYIPETTSRTILSATIIAYAYNTVYANSSNPSGWGIRCSCDGGSNWTTSVIAGMYAESDENFGHLMVADVTAEFTARFSGASDTVRWGYYIYASAVTTSFGNVSAKLVITYEYDDTAHATRVKTVRIPIESLNGRLTTSYAQIRQGSVVDQIPQLTGSGSPFLPEASVVLRQVFLELWGNTLPNSVTDSTVTLRLDAGGTTYAYTGFDNTQDSSTFIRLMWDLTAETFTAAKALYGISAAETSLGFLGGWLTVTYEYDNSSSTTILNSLYMGMDNTEKDITTTGDNDQTTFEFYAEEPGTLTLKQSGIFFNYLCSSTSTTLNIKVGSQTLTGYTPTADGAMCGQESIIHRIDSGGYRGAGFTLARGRNEIITNFYATSETRIGNVSQTAIINYTSGSHASGDGIYSHSVFTPIWGSNRAVATILKLDDGKTPPINEANNFIVNVSPVIYSSGLCATLDYAGLAFEVQSGELDSVGWVFGLRVISTGVAENGCGMHVGNFTNLFRQFTAQAGGLPVLTTTNRYWYLQGTSKQYGLGLWHTYHTITFTISGTVTDYVTGDGSGITVKLYKDSGVYIGSATTSAGGGYTYTWYDNTEEVFAYAEIDATHVGASVTAVAA